MYPNNNQQPEQPQQPQQPPQAPPPPPVQQQPAQFAQPQPQSQPQVQQQPEYSIEYLNEISGANAAQTGGPSKLVMIIAGVVGLLAVILFAVMLFASGPSASDKATDVYLRIQTLESLASESQDDLRNNDLRAINSGLALQLTNSLNDLQEPLGNAGVDTGKISKNSSGAETAYASAIQSDFDDAKLNVQLDNTYAREMSYQLETLRAMMQSTYDATSSASLKEALDNTDKQLAPFREKLSNFIN